MRIQDGELLRKDVRVDVPGPHVFQDQFGIGALGRARPEIHHHGHAGERAAFNGPIHGGPGRMLRVPGLLRPVVRRFHAHDDVRVLVDGVGAELRVHAGNCLLKAAIHAVGDDVEESQHAHGGAVDHFFLQTQKGTRPGAAGIDNRGHAGGQRQISENPQWHVGVRLSGENQSGSEPPCPVW